jgi:hypothetical protein
VRPSWRKPVSPGTGWSCANRRPVSRDLPDIVALTWDDRGSTPLVQTARSLARDAGQREIGRRFFTIITDLVGSPTELVAENGDIAWRTRSTLWGTTAWNRSSTAYTPLRFPGQYHAPETGLGLSPYQENGGNAETDPRNLDYLFNKDIEPDSHNSPRALQNELQLHRIGIPDTPRDAAIRHRSSGP